MAEEANNLQESGEFGPKLTDWAKEPSIQELKLDWESSKPAHDLQISKIDRWNDLLHVRGSAKPKKRKGRSGVQPKLIRRQAEWRYSALTEPFLGTNELFKVSPATFEDAKASRQNRLLLNHQFRNQINRVKFIDDYVRSVVDEGTCIVQTGWKRHTVKVKQDVPVYEHVEIENEEELQAFQAAFELKQSDPRTYEADVAPEMKAAIDFFLESGEGTVARDTGEVETVEVEKVLMNRPTAEIRSPKNVFIDPSCEGDLEKALFIGVSFETTKADLIKEGKRYRNLDKVNWEGNAPLSQPDHETQTPDTFQLKDALRKKVVAYEYWGFHDINKDGCLKPIVVTWIGDIIIRMEESPFPDEKLPFVVVPYLPVKRELYGEPDAELLEDNQAILGAVSRGLIDLLGRSANGQRGMAKGLLDPLNKRRFENGEDYEFNPNLTPANGIVDGKYPEIPQSAMLMLNLQNQEAEALTGVKSFAGGMSGEAYGEVAAAIRGVLDAASKREMAILRRLAQGIIDIGKKFAAMNAVFLSEEETVRITNDKFEVVKREDLKGHFDIIVDISTAEVDNAQAQDLGFMLQTIGPDSDPEMRKLILAEIADLKRMPDFAQRIRAFKPEPDPLLMKQRELEIAKLEAEIAKLKSEVAFNQARAKQAASEADKTDLDYVEQETGTKHERDMQKQRGQAKGNIALATANAILKSRKPDEKPGDVEAAMGFAALQDMQDENNDDLEDAPGMAPAPAIAEPRAPIVTDPGVM